MKEQQCFILLKNSKKPFLNLNKMLQQLLDFEQKIVNLLGNADSESSKFATTKWYVINDQNNTDYDEGSEDGATVKFETKVIKSNRCDYSDAYILVTGDITATGGNTNTRVAF